MQEVLTTLGEEYEGREKEISGFFFDLEKTLVRDLVINQQRRIDSRSYTDVRPITCEVGLLSRTHGSALFSRGETQALAIATLGTVSDEQKIETLSGDTFKAFMLHYNFPPYSVGETRMLRGPSRREIGHGALAERSLARVLPTAGRISLYHPHRLRNPLLQRLLLHGHGLRWLPGHDGCRYPH